MCFTRWMTSIGTHSLEKEAMFAVIVQYQKMKARDLCVLLCTVTAVVGAHGLSLLQCTKHLGEECGATVQCCQGCCEEGFCKNSTSCPKTCEDLLCQSWQECFYPLTSCENDTSCNRQPFCRPKRHIGIPKLRKRNVQVPVINDPCAVVDCTEGYECQTVSVQCSVEPCPQPSTTCVPKQGTAVPKQLTRYERETFPNDPCAIVRCKEGYECQFVRIACFVEPCPQPPPQCVPKQGTVDSKQLDRYSRGTFNEDPCAVVRCRGDHECQAVSIHCFKAPCPRPRAKCVPKQSAAVLKEQTRSVRETLHTDPCAVAFCMEGYECHAVPIQCFVEPCPKVSAKCVPRQGSMQPNF